VQSIQIWRFLSQHLPPYLHFCPSSRLPLQPPSPLSACCCTLKLTKNPAQSTRFFAGSHLSQLVLLSLILCSAFAFAEPVRLNSDADSDSVPEAFKTLRSPRDTMETFIKAMEKVKKGDSGQIKKAISTLDLSAVNPLVRWEKGNDLAWILYKVLELTHKTELSVIPATEDGEPYTHHEYSTGTVTIARLPDQRWLFSDETIRDLPKILDELSVKKPELKAAEETIQLPWHIRFRRDLPEELKVKILLLERWQWLGILFVIGLGVVVDKLIKALLEAVTRRWRQLGGVKELQELPDDWLRPLGLLMMAAIWWIGVNLLGLSSQALLVLLVAVKVLAGLSGVWAGYRVVDFFDINFRIHSRRTENKLDDLLVPLVRKTLKVFVTVVGILFIASNFNLNLTSLIAGLGLGGLAFALAAKDMVENLFGSITVVFDQSFHVGDWVVVGDIEGSVEEIGLRSTRIRTFYNSVVTVPNSHFITASVDNMGKRSYRRMKTTLSLTYDTSPEKIEAFCEGVRELIRLHPYMRKDYYQVYFNQMSASSLDVLVYVFLKAPDWSTELRERHRFLLDILRLADALGVAFAFPTQTLHLKRDVAKSEEELEMADEKAIAKVLETARETSKTLVESTGTSKELPPVKFPTRRWSGL